MFGPSIWLLIAATVLGSSRTKTWVVSLLDLAAASGLGTSCLSMGLDSLDLLLSLGLLEALDRVVDVCQALRALQDVGTLHCGRDVESLLAVFALCRNM